MLIARIFRVPYRDENDADGIPETAVKEATTDAAEWLTKQPISGPAVHSYRISLFKMRGEDAVARGISYLVCRIDKP